MEGAGAEPGRAHTLAGLVQGQVPSSAATASAQPRRDLSSPSSPKWLTRPHGCLSTTLLSLTLCFSTAATGNVQRHSWLPQLGQYAVSLYGAEARDVAKHPIRCSSLIRSGTQTSAQS